MPRLHWIFTRCGFFLAGNARKSEKHFHLGKCIAIIMHIVIEYYYGLFCCVFMPLDCNVCVDKGPPYCPCHTMS